MTANVRGSLPTFFIIGAPKAGTTSLHEYLSQHPDIAMTSIKEPMCFASPDWERRLDDYERLFRRPAAVRGESSTAYSSFPWAPEVPVRIHSVLPESRLIYLVRDPIPRTLTHYAQNLWDFPGGVRPFDKLMDELEDPMNMPVWASRYATQLERWLDHFDRERVLVLDQRELLTERAATLRRVFGFLDVDPNFHTSAWETEHNIAGEHRRPTALARRLGRHGARLARSRLLAPMLTRAVPIPTLTARQRERLVALLVPEVERLRELTGLATDQWSL